jgi:hypothetical protein
MKIKKIPWIIKIVILFIGTLVAGTVPAVVIMWANYNFDPTVCWTNIYGGWVIVPMIVACSIWGGLALNYLEKRLKVCSHDW